jgi:hypothetical protein
MAINTPDEILRFARLDYSVVKVEEVDDALAFASDMVAFLSPEDDSARSLRVNPLRKRAEAYIATAELYERVATYLHLTAPPKQVLAVLNFTLGTDFPTPDLVQKAFEKTADRYRMQGETWAQRIQPITAAIDVV